MKFPTRPPPDPGGSESPAARGIAGGAQQSGQLDKATDDSTTLGPAVAQVASTCEHCTKPFTPRTGSGGTTQRFCSSACRKARHASVEAQRPTFRTPASEPSVVTSDVTSDVGPLIGDLARAGVAAELVGRVYNAMMALIRAGQPDPDPDSDSDAAFWLKDKDAVALPQQLSIAIYENAIGHLVIRQERGLDDAEDQFIYLAKSNVRVFVDRLLDVAGIGGGSRCPRP